MENMKRKQADLTSFFHKKESNSPRCSKESEQKRGITRSLLKPPQTLQNKSSVLPSINSCYYEEEIPIKCKDATNTLKHSANDGTYKKIMAQFPAKKKQKIWEMDQENGHMAPLASRQKSSMDKSSGPPRKAVFTVIKNGYKSSEPLLQTPEFCWEKDDREPKRSPSLNDSLLEFLDDCPDFLSKPSGSKAEPDEADFQPSSPNEGLLMAYLVLEVTRSQYENAGFVRWQKNLRLLHEDTVTEKSCCLRGDWDLFEASPGDIVYVKGLEDDVSTECIIDDESQSFITLFPDILVSGTTISTGVSCKRQAVLGETFRADFQSEPMLIGSICHELFDWAIEKKDFDPEFLRKIALKLLSEVKYLDALYACGLSETAALAKIMEFFPALKRWGDHFVNGIFRSDIDNSVLNLSYQSGTSDHINLHSVKDIEENIWCPSLGLKGKIDVTAEVAIHRTVRNSERRLKDPDLRLMPLELKTGKMFAKLGTVEHRAQVILYTLMLTEKYSVPVDSGLLYYVKGSHMQSIPASHREKHALLLKRNELVRFLAPASSSHGMPGLLRDSHKCKRCPQLRNCMLHYKCIESGMAQFSGVGDTFDDITGHISKEESQYFAKWYRLIMAERREEAKSSSADQIWKATAIEREKLGKTLSGLALQKKVDGESFSSKSLYEFRRSPSSPFANVPLNARSFVTGDVVIISQENAVTYAIGTGLISSISDSSVIVQTQRKIQLHMGLSYRLDRSSPYRSTDVALTNIAALFSSSKEKDVRLRRLALGLDPPSFGLNFEEILFKASKMELPLGLQFENRWSVSREQSAAITKVLSSVNVDQKKAILKCLAARDYAMVLGMPGTGKTTTIARLVQVLVLLGKSVLLASYTNSAVDNVLQKLLKLGVDFLRLGSADRIHPVVKPFSVQELCASITTVQGLRDLYETKPVVGTTCLSIKNPLFSHRHFDYCIVDEASQVTQPVCIGPLRFASTFVLVGDHYQLPPLVQSIEARTNGMDESLFKTLSEAHPTAVIALKHQYRMNSCIMQLSNTLTYSHRMVCGNEMVAKQTLSLPLFATLRQTWKGNAFVDALTPENPVVFVNTDPVPCLENHSGFLVYNEKEALLVCYLTLVLTKAGLSAKDIGIISPYRLQVNVIRKTMKKENLVLTTDLEIDTMDKFQGRDKSCVIISLVRSNDKAKVGELLSDWKRMNVAITRAKKKLIFVGSSVTLRASFVTRDLITALEETASLVSASNLFADIAILKCKADNLSPGVQRTSNVS